MTALIVAGGGMRSAFACGVLQSFQEAGLAFDAVYGTSAGGAAGAWYAQGLADGFARTFEHARDPRILSWRRAGLRQGPFLDLDYLLGEVYPGEGFETKRIQAAPHPTIVTATTTAGQSRYLDLRRVDAVKALKATMSLPILAGPPVLLGDAELVDGGVKDPLPVARAIRDGHRRIVLVLNRDERRRRAEPRSIRWLLARHHPGLVRLAGVHHRLVMDAVALALAPPDRVRADVLHPAKPTGVSRFCRDLGTLRAAIEQGRREGHVFLRGPGRDL